DAAGYGPLTITKALTVTAIGIEASITTNATNVDGIIVAAGAGDAVAIRGLTLFSGTNGGGGIVVTSAKSVAIRDCTVNGFPANGISLFPTTSLDAELDGVSSDNNAGQGLSIVPSGPALTLVAADSHFGGNAFSGVLVSAVNSTGTI